MKTNVSMIDRDIRVIFGILLLGITFVFPLVTTTVGKSITTVIGVILLGTGAAGY